ncbi:MAG: hypothetical protein PQJ58_00780 [Spirochaetales bacterium]|nr:hypothetical protein [Spirochaetales bacterium]
MSRKNKLDKHIIKLLNQYFLSGDTQQEKARLAEELAAILYSPALILGCDFIPSESRLMKEAVALSDAFESLTNGMPDESAFAAIDGIKEDSLLFPWYGFVKGVQSFYEGDHDSCLSHMARVPRNTAPSRFGAFFQIILTGGSDGEDKPEWSQLSKNVLESKGVIRDSLELIMESAEMEDLLLESAGLLIRDIVRDDRDSAAAILMWCFEQLQLKDILSDKAVLKGRQLFGEQEGYRLSALATLSFDPDRSLVFWLHSALACLNESETTQATVRAYLKILKDVSETVQSEFDLSEEYIRLIGSLVSELAEQIQHIYPSFPGTDSEDDDPFSMIAGLSGEKQQKQRKTREIRQSAAVQLELFAF